MRFKFKGAISSRPPGGPPHEAEILEFNPNRKERILAATGWDDLYPGSLNLEVNEETVQQLLLYEPLIKEPWESVSYPPGRGEHIPQKRGGYLYYKATLTCSGGEITEDVLVRRAQNPLPKRLEIFAPKKLRDKMNLKDGELVVCRIVNS